MCIVAPLTHLLPNINKPICFHESSSRPLMVLIVLLRTPPLFWYISSKMGG